MEDDYDGEYRLLFCRFRSRACFPQADIDISHLSLHRDLSELYQIKLPKDGYGLVYQFIDEKIVIYVIAAGRKIDNEIYELTLKLTE